MASEKQTKDGSGKVILRSPPRDSLAVSIGVLHLARSSQQDGAVSILENQHSSLLRHAEVVLAYCSKEEPHVYSVMLPLLSRASLRQWLWQQLVRSVIDTVITPPRGNGSSLEPREFPIPNAIEKTWKLVREFTTYLMADWSNSGETAVEALLDAVGNLQSGEAEPTAAPHVHQILSGMVGEALVSWLLQITIGVIIEHSHQNTVSSAAEASNEGLEATANSQPALGVREGPPPCIARLACDGRLRNGGLLQCSGTGKLLSLPAAFGSDIIRALASS